MSEVVVPSWQVQRRVYCQLLDPVLNTKKTIVWAVALLFSVALTLPPNTSSLSPTPLGAICFTSFYSCWFSQLVHELPIKYPFKKLTAGIFFSFFFSLVLLSSGQKVQGFTRAWQWFNTWTGECVIQSMQCWGINLVVLVCLGVSRTVYPVMWRNHEMPESKTG